MAEKTHKSRPFKVKNKAQTLPKQVQNNFEKVQKTTFLTQELVKNDPSKWSKMGHILTQNLNYRGHLWTFEAENTPKSGPFKVENNALTLPKQLQKNFEKVQKTTFSTPKMVKNDPSKRSK